MSFGKAISCALVAISVVAVVTPAWAFCDDKQTNDTPTTRYTIKGGEVYDTKTKLTWQRCSVGQEWKDGSGCTGEIKQMTLPDAVKAATAPWRLPEKDELASLISSACRLPSLNTEVFPGVSPTKTTYWSHTVASPTTNYGVGFDGGFVFNDPPNYSYSARLVRTGQ